MKIFKLLAVAFLGLSIVACSSDSNDKVDTPEKGDAVVQIKLSTGGLPVRGLSGEEEPVGDEGKITNFEVYVFNADGTPDTRVGETALGDDDGNGYFTKTPSETNFQFLVTAGNDKQFIVLANTSIGAVANLAALDANLSALQFAGSDVVAYNTKTIPANGFEMSGYAKINCLPNVTTPVTVPVSRLVSKIYAPKFAPAMPVDLTAAQLEIVWPGENLDPSLVTVDFAFTRYAMGNGIDKSDVLFKGNANRVDTEGTTVASIFVPNWNLWSHTGKTYLDPAFNVDGSIKNTYSGEVGGSWLLDGTSAGTQYVYSYENKFKLAANNSNRDAETVYAYIIEGTLATAGQATKTRYWTVDIIGEYDYHVLRNCTYTITINKITTPGYNTPEDAWKDRQDPPPPGEASANVTIEVKKWRVFTSTTGM